MVWGKWANPDEEIRTLETKNWSCSASHLEQTLNFVWEVFELLAGSAPKD